ncbi:hypothetical protein ACWDWU_17015 [Streptomyces sp. NPDC003442]
MNGGQMQPASGIGVYLERRKPDPQRTADGTASYEEMGRAAIRAGSLYLASPTTSLEDARAVIVLLQFELDNMIEVAAARKRRLEQITGASAPSVDSPSPIKPGTGREMRDGVSLRTG